MIASADRERYWAAVEDGAAARAHQVAAELVAAGTPLPAVLDDLVGAAQRQVGALWASNSWSVQREHAATAVGEHVVQRLRADHAAVAGPGTGPMLLVACAESEWHAIPALLLTARLEHAGHRVRYLGADVSTAALQAALHDHSPRAALVSASLASSLVFARRHVEATTEVGVPVVVGGTAFDAAGRRARAIGATAHATSAASVTRLLAELPRRVRPAQPLRGENAREAYAIAAALPSLVASVVGRLRSAGGHRAGVIEDQVPHVLGSIAGALLTGDPAVVTQARAWLDEVARARDCDRALVEIVWSEAAQLLREFPLATAAVAA